MGQAANIHVVRVANQVNLNLMIDTASQLRRPLHPQDALQRRIGLLLVCTFRLCRILWNIPGLIDKLQPFG